MLSYPCQVVFDSTEDENKIRETLGLSTELYNFFSEVAYGSFTEHGCVRKMELHHEAYYKARSLFPSALSQMVIKAGNDVVATYASIKSNHHEIDTFPVRKNPCLRLDKRLHRWHDERTLSVSTIGSKRVKISVKLYPKVIELMGLYKQTDPLLYIKDNKVYISLTFDNPELPVIPEKAVGVDLGMRFLAVTSEGKGIKGSIYNATKREIRYLKRTLKENGSKSAKRKLRDINRMEANFSDNFIHHVANEILDTDANVIVLEDLDNKKMKAKKHKNNDKSRINQIPFGKTRDVITYKAKALGKSVIMVSPAYTSQKDSRGLKNGERRGRRYYAKDGKVLDSDLNAAINIALKSKHSVSFVEPLDGSLKPETDRRCVNSPIVGSVYRTLTSPIL